MADYKYANENGTMIVKQDGNLHIPNDPRNADWQKFQEWVANGGIPDPWKTEEERQTHFLQEKLVELEGELDKRFQTAINSTSLFNMVRAMQRYMVLLRMETKGTIPQNRIPYLDNIDSIVIEIEILENRYDAAKAWLEDPTRTVEEIKGFDVLVNPNWP